MKREDPLRLYEASSDMYHLVTALTLGDSYVDANPEQEEEDSKAHEERGHQGDEELFVNVTCVLGRGDLITR